MQSIVGSRIADGIRIKFVERSVRSLNTRVYKCKNSIKYTFFWKYTSLFLLQTVFHANLIELTSRFSSFSPQYAGYAFGINFSIVIWILFFTYFSFSFPLVHVLFHLLFKQFLVFTFIRYHQDFLTTVSSMKVYYPFNAPWEISLFETVLEVFHVFFTDTSLHSLTSLTNWNLIPFSSD